MKKIRDMPANERPRERLVKQGVSSLSDAELLAVILRTGTYKENAVELSREILKKFNIKNLSHASITKLKKVFGVGEAKACQILASFELGRRLASFRPEKYKKINNPKEAAALIFPKLIGLKKEHLIGIYLDSRKKIIKEETIFIGSLDASIINPREIFEIALNEGAAAIILAHNHPSGDMKPSIEDIKITKELAKAGGLLGIELLDHIIISGKKYFSMRENNIFD